MRVFYTSGKSLLDVNFVWGWRMRQGGKANSTHQFFPVCGSDRRGVRARSLQCVKVLYHRYLNGTSGKVFVRLYRAFSVHRFSTMTRSTYSDYASEKE